MAETAYGPGSANSPALGLEAKIEFNGLVIHDVQLADGRVKADRYQLKVPAGLRKTEVRDARQTNPSRDGETALIARRGGKTITLTGTIHAGNLMKLRDMQTALDDATDDMLERPLIFTAPPGKGRSVMIYVRLMDKDVSDDTSSGKFQSPFQLVFRASQPKFLSTTAKIFTQNYWDYDDLSTSPVDTRFTTLAGSTPTWSPGNLSLPAGSFYKRTPQSWKMRPLATVKVTVPTISTLTTGRRFGIYACGSGASSRLYGCFTVTDGPNGLVRPEIYEVYNNVETLLAAGTAAYMNPGVYYLQFKALSLDAPSRVGFVYTTTATAKDLLNDELALSDNAAVRLYYTYPSVSAKLTALRGFEEYGIGSVGGGAAISITNYKLNPTSIDDTMTLVNDGNGSANLKLAIATTSQGIIPVTGTFARSGVRYTNPGLPAGQQSFEFNMLLGGGAYTYDSSDGSFVSGGANYYSSVVKARQITLTKYSNSLALVTGQILQDNDLQQVTFTATWQDTWK